MHSHRAGAGLLGAAIAAILAAPALGSGSVGVSPNLGQLPDEVRFHARCGEVDLYFTNQAIVLDLRDDVCAIRIPLGRPGRIDPEGTRVTQRHYFRGDDPERWVTDVPVYDEILYRDPESGSELRILPQEGSMRYGYADPATELVFEGVDRVDTMPDGRRAVAIRGRTLWDEPATDGMRRLRWAAAGSPETPPAREPGAVLTYSSFIGGGLNDRAHALEVLGSGEIVMGGYSESPNFPTTPGSYQPLHEGGYDAVVLRFAADNHTLLWSTFLGGGLEDRVFAIHEDGNGDLVFAGHTYSDDFPTTTGAFDRTFGPPRDAYCAKLDGTGSQLLFSTLVGGSSLDRAWDMGLDSIGRPVLCGDTKSADFPVTEGALDTEIGPTYSDGFLVKIEADGSDIVWGTYIGGTSIEDCKYMAMFPDDSPVVVGTSNSPDLPVTAGSFQDTLAGSNDVFVIKLRPDGDAVDFGTYLGGRFADYGEVVVVDPSSGDVVVTGATSSPGFPVTEHAFDRTHNGAKDAFVLRLLADGSDLVWSTFVGGSENEEPWALALTPEGEAVFSGYVDSPDFPTTPDAFDLTFHGGIHDANLTMLDPTGSWLRHSTYLGGRDVDGGWELDLDGEGQPVVVGPTASWDFPTTEDAYDRIYNGGRDMYLARFQIGTPSSAPSPGGIPVPIPLSAQPNPFAERVELELELTVATSLRVLVLDAGGRVVARLHRGWLEPGVQRFHWDGRSSAGRRVPSGTYWARVEVGPSITQTPLVIVR